MFITLQESTTGGSAKLNYVIERKVEFTLIESTYCLAETYL